MGLKREAGEKPLVFLLFPLLLVVGWVDTGRLRTSPALETHKSVIFSQITHTHAHTHQVTKKKLEAEIFFGVFELAVFSVGS